MTTIDIILFCYKQEQYIEQALQSIYDQQVPADCSVRIIVADDCSPDNTLALIEKHAAESPFPITFLPKEPNMGISKNYKRSFAATTADYVFILEGDDYWLPGHMMQHMAFWQEHPECALVMNNVNCLQEETNHLTEFTYWPYETEYITADVRKQIEEGNQLGNLSGCSFQGQYLRELPSTLFDMPIADWMIGVMLAQRGLLATLQVPTSVYRVKASGVWAGRSKWKQTQILLKYAQMYDEYQNGKYHNMWRVYKKKVLHEARTHWTKFLPQCIQNSWHKIKSWIKS